MKRTRLVALLLTLVMALSLVFAGCSADPNYPVTVGHTKINEAPVKVIALSDNIADIICYTGYASKLAGVSDTCTQSELTEYVTSVGSETSPNTELIINSGATVVFTDTALNADDTDKLKNAGIKVITTLYPEDEDQLKSLYETVGAVLGGDKDGRQKGIESYERLISVLTTAQAEASSVAATKTMCYLYIEDNVLKAATGSVNDGMVLNFLGTINIAQNFTEGYADENILKLSNPDYIFFDSAEVMERIGRSQQLQSINAIKKGNVFELKRDEILRQGESMVKVQSFMLSSMFPNFVEPPVEKSEDISSAYGITLTEDMSFKNGDDNENIVYIQQRLKDLKFLDLGEDAPTSYFGDMSEEALKAFQSANGLEASGIASFETLKKLFKSDAVGADGEKFVPEVTTPETTEPETTAPAEDATQSATNAPADSGNYPISITDSTSYQYGDEHDDIVKIQNRLVELLYLSFDEGDSATTYYGAGTEGAILNFQASNNLPQTGVADAETLRVLFSSDAKIPQ